MTEMKIPELNLLGNRRSRYDDNDDDYGHNELTDNEKARDNRRRRKERRLQHQESKKNSEFRNLQKEQVSSSVTFTLSIAGAWRGPIEVSCDCIVRDLKMAIMKASGVHYSYQHLSLRRGKKGSFQTTTLSDNYSSLRSYGIKSRCRILLINAKPDEDARLLRLKRLREKKERRKHETLKAKLERQKRRAQRAQQLSDWRLDAKGNLLRKGKVVYPNGAIYDGEWMNQKHHGKGTLVDVNGDSHEGMFEDGVPNGFGKRVYAFVMIDRELVKGKRSYEGYWKDGLYDGTGTYVVGNGETYVGEFQKGLYHGKGRYEYLDTRIYEGEFRRGYRSGFGKMIYPNGDVYEGEWKMDSYEGRGKLILRRAGILEGYFRMGVLHGEGKRTYADGRIFEGTFYHGERKKGKMTINFEEWYEGEFENSMRHGYGFMKWRDGNTYRGNWFKGIPWGKGKMVFSDGGYYDGEFKAMTNPKQFVHGQVYPKPDGKFHGYGTFFFLSLCFPFISPLFLPFSSFFFFFFFKPHFSSSFYSQVHVSTSQVRSIEECSSEVNYMVKVCTSRKV